MPSHAPPTCPQEPPKAPNRPKITPTPKGSKQYQKGSKQDQKGQNRSKKCQNKPKIHTQTGQTHRRPAPHPATQQATRNFNPAKILDVRCHFGSRRSACAPRGFAPLCVRSPRVQSSGSTRSACVPSSRRPTYPGGSERAVGYSRKLKQKN